MLPVDYYASRDRFRVLAASLGTPAQSYVHAPQADGNELSTDVAYLGPRDATTIIVIASGTHGVEGYAGAACQFHFMQHYRDRFAGHDIAFVLVHAVNPWGYAHDRRVTHEGVDLNRNFIDFPLPPSVPSAYRDYHARLVARYRPLPAGLWNELRLLCCALTARRRQQLQTAITAGQYDMPTGLFFGGAAPTQSRLIWERIVDVYTAGRSRAFLLDLHTGLGKAGAGELISYLPSSADAFHQMDRWFGGSLRSMVDGASVSAPVEGTLTAAFDRTVNAESYAVGLEFGTCAPLTVLNALRADHWYHHNAANPSSQQRERVRRNMKNAFAIANNQWHDLVTARFMQIMQQLVTALATR